MNIYFKFRSGSKAKMEKVAITNKVAAELVEASKKAAEGYEGVPVDLPDVGYVMRELQAWPDGTFTLAYGSRRSDPLSKSQAARLRRV